MTRKGDQMSAVTETEKNINTEKKTTNRFVEVAKSLMKINFH